MPSPIRIEYPGAFHQVMNRGRSHQNIFHDETGRRNNRPVGEFAMYACHYYGGLSHNDIAKEFNQWGQTLLKTSNQ